MTPSRAVSGCLGIILTVALNLSWVAIVGLVGLAVVVWVGRGVLYLLGG